ncbi:hypothetical protein EVAR_24543_1 [Eumeta japonica]|uniref:Uncharacterized protein n=1 Tax=Eumeta variegata TaxID=151549 RepID=A0A4C1US70_EUMVA|nr:hypothetical protein EVAR_24543_1 [Eumeta japonica]
MTELKYPKTKSEQCPVCVRQGGRRPRGGRAGSCSTACLLGTERYIFPAEQIFEAVDDKTLRLAFHVFISISRTIYAKSSPLFALFDTLILNRVVELSFLPLSKI